MILIALGANLPSKYGEPEETLKAALRALEARGVDVVRQSSVWLTAPVPVSDQPWYRNAVICVKTSLEPFELLELLHEVEAEFGRVRAAKNEARALDLDLLAYDDLIINENGFTVPHSRMSERAFVLKPLQEVAPGWKHPVSGRLIEDLITDLPENQEIEKVA